MSATAKPAAIHQNEAAKLFVAANPHALIVRNARKLCPECRARLSRCWTLLHGWVLYCGVCRHRTTSVLSGFTHSRTTGKKRVFAKHTRFQPRDPAEQTAVERMLR
jgi:hypothetical protein